MRKIKKHSRRHGVVLIVVMMAVALAGTLSMTVLSTGTSKSLIAANAQRGTQAEYLAESALNVAVHQLKKNGTLSGMDSVSIDGIEGSAQLVLTLISDNHYKLTAIASAGEAGAETSYEASARVKVDRSFRPEVEGNSYAGGFSSPLNVPLGAKLNVTGNMVVDGSLSAIPGVNLNVTGKTLYRGGLLSGLLSLLLGTESTQLLPQTTDISDVYHTTYKYDGNTYAAQALWTNNLTESLPRPQDLATNPAGIYYYNGNLTIRSNVTVNGTIRVRNGSLNINGTNITINPRKDFPAMVVDSRLVMTSASSVTSNGLTFVGNNIDKSGLTGAPTVNVNGALVIGLGGTIGSLFNGTINLRYDEEKAIVSEFTKNPETRITLLDWTP